MADLEILPKQLTCEHDFYGPNKCSKCGVGFYLWAAHVGDMANAFRRPPKATVMLLKPRWAGKKTHYDTLQAIRSIRALLDELEYPSSERNSQ